jgi:hypothetical protein
LSKPHYTQRSPSRRRPIGCWQPEVRRRSRPRCSEGNAGGPCTRHCLFGFDRLTFFIMMGLLLAQITTRHVSAHGVRTIFGPRYPARALVEAKGMRVRLSLRFGLDLRCRHSTGGCHAPVGDCSGREGAFARGAAPEPDDLQLLQGGCAASHVGAAAVRAGLRLLARGGT